MHSHASCAFNCIIFSYCAFIALNTRLIMFKITLLIFLVLLNLSVSQLNGFWWLNENLPAFGELKIPEIKFEETDDNGTDDTDKIVFEDDFQTGAALNVDNSIDDTNGDSFVFNFPINAPINNTMNSTKIEDEIQDNNNSRYKDFRLSKSVKFSNVNKSSEETLIFPSESNERDESLNYFAKHVKRNLNRNFKETDVEHICTFISEISCYINQGTIHEFIIGREIKKATSKHDVICCIIPVRNKISKEKVFNTDSSNFRFPRSVTDTDRGQIQREALLKKIIRPAATTVKVKKIVNDYDYVDPYWNIKSSNIKTPVKITNRPTSYDIYYDTVESDEDYASELPKPGLLGVYGATRRPVDYRWVEKPAQTFNGYGVNTGYFSSLDPRLDDRTSTFSVKTKPLISSSEELYDAESHVVTYHANPDFQVLQDFKLLNLIKNKSRVHDRNSRKTITEKVFDYDSYEAVPTRSSHGGVTSSEIVYDDVDDDEWQPYEKCGHRSLDYNDSDENVEIGTHPWLAMVVRSKRQRSILCSAMIIHPRAAITAATCVNGAATGDVVVRAGEWDLTEIRNSQQRLASIYIHPLFKAGVLSHDLAILHWARPLRLNKAIQPVCLGDNKVGEKCTFVGWNGPDQTIHTQPRMQHATIMKRRTCLEHLSNVGFLKNLPNSAFCATTDTTECVSGLGGSLLCQRDNKMAAVGLTVWRKRCDKSPIILLSIREWTKRALKKIGI